MPFRCFLFCLFSSVLSAGPRDSVPIDAAAWPEDYRLHLEGPATVRFSKDLVIRLDNPSGGDVAVEHPTAGPPELRVWQGGKLVRGPEEIPALKGSNAKDFPGAGLDFGTDFTLMGRFVTEGDGTLFSMCTAEGRWEPQSKALFIREGRLVYDIGWLGEMTGGPGVNDGKPHVVVLMVKEGTARLWLDGRKIAEKKSFSAPDKKGHVFKIGRASPDFGGEFKQGTLHEIKVWKRMLPEDEISRLFNKDSSRANTPDFNHQASASTRPVVEQGRGWVQALERSDHAGIVAGWNEATLAEGKTIYQSLCVTCHGTNEQPGSLPTALRFHEGTFKNGSDPYSMYLTLTRGYGQMMAQPQYTTAQKYAVIQYIRETFLRAHNPSQLSEIDLNTLPRGLARAQQEKSDTSKPPYQRMELGNFLMWTLQVAPGNIAQKAIAVRLDDGPGGVTKGRAWMIYDHDTMSVAAATTGGFIDWKGIAFDGSHGTHTSLTGDRQFVNPVGPGWRSPAGSWEDDARVTGKDGRRYGPLPKEWATFEGVYEHGSRVVIASRVLGAPVLESPGWIDYGSTPVFTRTLNVGTDDKQAAVERALRLAPEDVEVVMTGQGELKRDGGFWIAILPPGSKSRFFISRADKASLEALAKSTTEPLDLSPLTKGGPSRWTRTITTTSVAGKDDGAFVADTFPLPLDNPWQSWLRPGGFDFTPDGKAAVVAMWNGDVWRVEGVLEKAPSRLTWRRIASGLFQPLGVKFRGDELFITCRDQIAKLVDLNGDGETDFIRCFNNDAQVTEHFHEFAMGLQTDAEGNLYYAKSGRHALDSVVPQHGTLLKVSADGATTEILATGFRAANGVCVNGDGTFYVTDQEGFWTPKNRINLVKPGGFYGNLYGYSNVTDSSDSAMEPPMVWITNAKDRSPAELVRVPDGVWGNLGGSLLNLSYGTGQVFIVPHEQVQGAWQGAVCELPLPAFDSGIMRGRFATDGALYACGLFAWAGNATTPGGFVRVRKGPAPARVPLQVHAAKGELSVRFSDPVEPGECAIQVWSLKRSKEYGSKHYDQHPLPITGVKTEDGGRLVIVSIPDLAPTHCYELKVADRVIHGSIHRLAP